MHNVQGLEGVPENNRLLDIREARFMMLKVTVEAFHEDEHRAVPPPIAVDVAVPEPDKLRFGQTTHEVYLQQGASPPPLDLMHLGLYRPGYRLPALRRGS